MKSFEDGVEVFKSEPTALDLVSSGEIMQRQSTPYVTAVSVVKQRKLTDVEMRVKAEVELAPLRSFYKWDVTDKHGNKKPVSGPTIGLTMSIARNYGNCAVDIEIEETPTHYTFTPVFLDLETGFTFRRAFRQRKNQSIGMKDKDRAEDITFQIGQSKAIRNVIKGAVPQALIDNAIEHAHEIEKSKWTPEKIEQKRKGAISAFKEKFGITLEQLGAYMGDPDPAKWSIDKLVDLGSVYCAIESGDITKEEVFPLVDNEVPPGAMKFDPTPSKKKEKKETVPAEPTIPVMDYKSPCSPDANGNYIQNGYVFTAKGEYLCLETEYKVTELGFEFDPKKDK